MRLTLCALVCCITLTTSAQKDTIRIMQYNLLNYGNAANPVAYKNPRLSAIIQYVQPDIFGVNEVRNDSTLCDSIKALLGANWSRGYYSNTNNEVQANMLFWRNDMFDYKGQEVVCSNLRDIVAYHLAYKDTIHHMHDTATVTVIVGHLKASGSSADEADRAAETQQVASYLSSQSHPGNYIFMGDFNLYYSTEQAYQNLINNPDSTARLNDPLNRPGYWHDDASFADIHTQSTRSTSLGDGGVTGGLDDRFDFILVSNSILTQEKGIKYLQGTYKVVGQDGQHFNQSLVATPTNTAAPLNVIQALYEMSDHLPVRADFLFDPSGSPTFIHDVRTPGYSVTNPFSDKLVIRFDKELAAPVSIVIYDVNGKVAIPVFRSASQVITVPSEALPTGMYYLSIRTADGEKTGKVLVKCW